MTRAREIDEVTAFHQWLGEVAAQTRDRFGAYDRLGTANYIDQAARLRAATCIQTGEAVSLARPLALGPGFHAATTFDPSGQIGLDRIEADCHGYSKTHMDALNHLSSNGMFYGDRPLAEGELPTIVDLAGRCLFTRAVFADIPAVRGTPWVSADEPVVAKDIDAALAGVDILPGDALLLYMGRNRWEMAGNTLNHEPGHESAGAGVSAQKPGAGRGAARWIVEHQISMLAWDFLDAAPDPDAPPEAKGTVHRLLPAAGLVMIDNCELSFAATVMSRHERRTAAIAALPLAVPNGTGSIVTPWLIL
jgi:kynurenine formamidase